MDHKFIQILFIDFRDHRTHLRINERQDLSIVISQHGNRVNRIRIAFLIQLRQYIGKHHFICTAQFFRTFFKVTACLDIFINLAHLQKEKSHPSKIRTVWLLYSFFLMNFSQSFLCKFISFFHHNPNTPAYKINPVAQTPIPFSRIPRSGKK